MQCFKKFCVANFDFLWPFMCGKFVLCLYKHQGAFCDVGIETSKLNKHESALMSTEIHFSINRVVLSKSLFQSVCTACEIHPYIVKTSKGTRVTLVLLSITLNPSRGQST